MRESQLGRIKTRLIELGRPDVRIIAVSKTHPPESISELIKEGQYEFGENRYSEARDKIPLVDLSSLKKERHIIYHHIGSLQTGNARQIPEIFQYVHGVSSIKSLLVMQDAALRIFNKKGNDESEKFKWPMHYLLQINLTEETGKSGMSEKELLSLTKFPENDAVKFSGFMTMGPTDQDIVKTREVFHKLRELRDQIYPGGELSMGMSGDWEIAVSEGASMIRLGSILFGIRKGSPWKP